MISQCHPMCPNVRSHLKDSLSVSVLLLAVVRDDVEEEGEDLAEALGEGVADSGPPGGGEDQGLELLRDDGEQLQQQREGAHVGGGALEVGREHRDDVSDGALPVVGGRVDDEP